VKYLGIDWATKHHVVALVGDDDGPCETWSVAHTWAAVCELVDRLAQEGGPPAVRIAMESGAPRLRDALCAAGYVVYEINPIAADRFRDRFSPAGAKDDRRDALVLAHAVRTDEPWLRPVTLASEPDQELRQRCRDRQSLVDHRRRFVQQLRQSLAESHEAILAIGRRLTSPFVLAILEAYPDAQSARGCRRPRLLRLMREHRVRAMDVDVLYATLRTEGFPLPDGVAGACADRVRWLARVIAELSRSIAEADAAIAVLFDVHSSREVLESVPGIGAIHAPYLASEIATRLGDAPDARSLQTLAGTCPITKRSGKQTRGYVGMRRACHKGLQGAMHTVARCSLRSSPWARAYYDQQRVRGSAHNAALRALSNKWLKIIARLLQTGERYDELRHQNALRNAGVPWAPKANAETERAA
jgi:transposase